jgi:hypothetical protein
MLAASRKAIISTASKATYATAATANGLQITSASNGVKVASSQEPGQTASLAVVVNGGARAESGKNAGVSHFLKNYGFKVIILYIIFFILDLCIDKKDRATATVTLELSTVQYSYVKIATYF